MFGLARNILHVLLLVALVMATLAQPLPASSTSSSEQSPPTVSLNSQSVNVVAVQLEDQDCPGCDCNLECPLIKTDAQIPCESNACQMMSSSCLGLPQTGLSFLLVQSIDLHFSGFACALVSAPPKSLKRPPRA